MVQASAILARSREGLRVPGGADKEWEQTALSRFIKRQRLALGLSQSDLARRLGYQHSYISQFEKGRLPDLDAPDFIERWAQAFEVDVELFIAEAELWRYNLVPATPTDLTPGERAVRAALKHLDEETRHRIAQGLRTMWQEGDTEPPGAPAQED